MNKSREKHYLSKSSIGTRQTLSLFRSSSKKKKEKIRAKISYRRREPPEGRKKPIDQTKLSEMLLFAKKQRQQRRANVALSSFAISRLKRQRERERKREIGKRKKNKPCRRSPLVGTFCQFPLRHRRCTWTKRTASFALFACEERTSSRTLSKRARRSCWMPFCCVWCCFCVRGVQTRILVE